MREKEDRVKAIDDELKRVGYEEAPPSVRRDAGARARRRETREHEQRPRSKTLVGAPVRRTAPSHPRRHHLDLRREATSQSAGAGDEIEVNWKTG